MILKRKGITLGEQESNTGAGRTTWNMEELWLKRNGTPEPSLPIDAYFRVPPDPKLLERGVHGELVQFPTGPWLSKVG